jgi:hypothetical protein
MAGSVWGRLSLTLNFVLARAPAFAGRLSWRC